MLEFDSFGTLTVLFVLVLYATITFIRNIAGGVGSLRDNEKIHRFLLVSGGLLGGWALGAQQISFEEINFLDENFLISILLALLGLVIILVGTTYLKSQLWTPLINISEYSAEFGSNFIATRLPETGGLELVNFAKRFNSNAIDLASDISKLEIQVEKVTENIEDTVRAGMELTGVTSTINDFAIQYGQSTHSQSELVREIGDEVRNFTSWYDRSQDQLQENFVELRSISEMGNLIAINAAVEASNLEVPNPGFETLASKLRELARSLETRQEGLRRLIDEISNNYEAFKSSIESKLEQSMTISESTTSLNIEIEGIISEINQKDLQFSDQYGELRRSISKFKESIPTAYA